MGSTEVGSTGARASSSEAVWGGGGGLGGGDQAGGALPTLIMPPRPSWSSRAHGIYPAGARTPGSGLLVLLPERGSVLPVRQGMPSRVDESGTAVSPTGPITPEAKLALWETTVFAGRRSRGYTDRACPRQTVRAPYTVMGAPCCPGSTPDRSPYAATASQVDEEQAEAAVHEAAPAISPNAPLAVVLNGVPIVPYADHLYLHGVAALFRDDNSPTHVYRDSSSAPTLRPSGIHPARKRTLRPRIDLAVRAGRYPV